MTNHAAHKTEPITAEEFITHQINLRHDGGILCPAVTADTFAAYPVTFGYHVKTSLGSLGYHTGEDHACPIGSRAVAVTYGEVIYTAEGGGSYGADYGNIMVVRSLSGFDQLYCHLSKFVLKVNDAVKPGVTLALTGESGHVTGPHLHYEVRPKGGHFGSDIRPLYAKQRGHRIGSI